MKSTQDLCMFLHQLSDALVMNKTVTPEEMISLEIFPDKSFRINTHNEGNLNTLFDSDEQDAHMDANDLPYGDIKNLAKTIKDDISVRDIKVEDL